jgi:thiol-disulfide isomerase/thioredoxin
MRKTWLILLFISLTTSLTAQVSDFRLRTLSGSMDSYSELKGDGIVLLDFWATWCLPCAEAIPGIVDLHEEFGTKGLSVIGINVDGPRNTSKLRPFLHPFGVTYPILLDPDYTVMSDLNVEAMPTVVLIDAKTDNILHIYAGYRPGLEARIKADIQKALGMD